MSHRDSFRGAALNWLVLLPSKRRAARPAMLAILCLAFLAATPPAVAAPSPTVPTRSKTAAKPSAPPMPAAYILVDADSGVVITERNPHVPLRPASTVKIMTGLTALERLSDNAKITVSERAAAMPAMKIGLDAGEVWPIKDIVHSIFMVSANDSAYALAENASGTAEAFAADMASTGARLGMLDSTFADPAGLDDSTSLNGGSRMSVYDLSIAARNALAVPQIADPAVLMSYKFTGPDGVPHSLRNHNDTFLESYDGATGLKTGYTSRAGRGLVCTASRNGRSMIVAVLDVYDVDGWCTRLLNQGFATPPDSQGVGERIPPVRIFTATQRAAALDHVPMPLGAPKLSTVTLPRAAAPQSTTTTTTTTEQPAPEPELTQARTPPVSEGISTATAQADRAEAAEATAGTAGLRTIVTTGLVTIACLCALVVWRRRVVKRRRRERILREEMWGDVRRRGMLTILDLEAAPTQPSHVSILQDR